MPAIPTNEPLELTAGDTWKWHRDDLAADYPAPAWTLSYYFKNPTSNFNFNAAANGAAFAVTVAMATTAGFAAGLYSWFAFVTDGVERIKVDEGTLKVLPNLAAAGNLDNREHARKVLTAIEAVLESRATLDQQEYTIGNRMLKRIPVPELLLFRQQYASEVAALDAAERLANGIGRSRKIQVRF